MSASHKILGLSPRELAGDLSPTQFELLVREYIAGRRKQWGLPSGDEAYGMRLELEAKISCAGQWEEWTWKLRDTFNSNWVVAEGFAGMPQEFERRKAFERASRTLLIESEASPPIGDEIPF